MNVYHTSTIVVEHPDTKHSRTKLDFGPGFYVTPFRVQAAQYLSRVKRRKGKPILNVYEYNGNTSGLSYRRFEGYDSEWLDFVMDCRGGVVKGDYDIIEGAVADDKVFETVNLFSNDLITKSTALERLRYHKPTWQICFATQKSIDQCLTFNHEETAINPREIIFQMKYSRIIGLMAKKLGVSREKAMDLFYTSETFAALRDPGCDLYVMSDEYLAEDVCREQEGYTPEP